MTHSATRPCPDSIDPAELIGQVRPVGEPELRLMGISALTGAATSDGTSSGLGNDTDFALLNALRVWSDAVLVGAETARKENYFGVKVSEQQRREREAAGQQPVPPIVVVSRSLDFDTDTQLITDTAVAPVFTVPNAALDGGDIAARADAIRQAGGEILPVGGDSLAAVVGALRERGHARIVCEGGPSVNTQLVEQDLVDVFHYTISPLAVQPSAVRLFGESDETCERRFELEAVHCTSDSLLFCRYRSGRDSSPQRTR